MRRHELATWRKALPEAAEGERRSQRTQIALRRGLVFAMLGPCVACEHRQLTAGLKAGKLPRQAEKISLAYLSAVSDSDRRQQMFVRSDKNAHAGAREVTLRPKPLRTSRSDPAFALKDSCGMPIPEAGGSLRSVHPVILRERDPLRNRAR